MIVEVLSPSTRARDAGAKLADYFSLASVRHYLLVRTERRSVIHHRRDESGEIRTSLVSSGTIGLEPPGVTLDIDEIYAE